MQTFNGGDACNLRYRDLTKDGVDVRVQEERSDDDEIGHGTEAAGYVVSSSERTIETLSANYALSTTRNG